MTPLQESHLCTMQREDATLSPRWCSCFGLCWVEAFDLKRWSHSSLDDLLIVSVSMFNRAKITSKLLPLYSLIYFCRKIYFSAKKRNLFDSQTLFSHQIMKQNKRKSRIMGQIFLILEAIFAEIDFGLLTFAPPVRQNPSCRRARVSVRFDSVSAKSKDAADESMDWS